MRLFADVFCNGLNKSGEELCGDQWRVLRTEEKTYIVLSDGLGSGVKANILANLTTSIIITMLKEEIALSDVIETVIETLPTCQVRKIAYATFTIISINNQTMAFEVINFDNPDPIFIRNNQRFDLKCTSEVIHGNEIIFCKGQAQQNDYLATISDGVWYAGLGQTHNLGWGRGQIIDYMANTLITNKTLNAEKVVQGVLKQTDLLYGNQPGDDASMAGVFFRPRREAMVFTGPPIDKKDDARIAKQLTNFSGRKIVCGGTTGDIVARYLKKDIVTYQESMKEDIPPYYELEGVDLLTEGVLTLNKAYELMLEVEGDYSYLYTDKDGAMLLALELLVADDITFVVGQAINSFYQNPSLPLSVSIRRNLVEKIVDYLQSLNKNVRITTL